MLIYFLAYRLTRFWFLRQRHGIFQIHDDHVRICADGFIHTVGPVPGDEEGRTNKLDTVHFKPRL